MERTEQAEDSIPEATTEQDRKKQRKEPKKRVVLKRKYWAARYANGRTCLSCGLAVEKCDGYPCQRCRDRNHVCITHPLVESPAMKQGEGHLFRNSIISISDGNRFRTEFSGHPLTKGRTVFQRGPRVSHKESAKIKKYLECWSKCYPNQGDELPTFTRYPNFMQSRPTSSTVEISEATKELDKLENSIDALVWSLDPVLCREKLDQGDLDDPSVKEAIERLALPSSEFVETVHAAASQYYTDLPKEQGEPMLYSLKPSTLLFLSILMQEMIREEKSQSKGVLLTQDQVNLLAPNIVDLMGESVLDEKVPLWMYKSLSYDLEKAVDEPQFFGRETLIDHSLKKR